jgi:hypothetical protein
MASILKSMLFECFHVFFLSYDLALRYFSIKTEENRNLIVMEIIFELSRCGACVQSSQILSSIGF